MDVQLITCPNSPHCTSVKMFLQLNGVKYNETVVSHEEMKSMDFKNSEMPILMVDGQIKMSGFDAAVLKELFG